MRASDISDAIARTEKRLSEARAIQDWARIEAHSARLARLNRQLSDLTEQGKLFELATPRHPSNILTVSAKYQPGALRAAAETGYWFCNDCDHVTEVNPDNRTCQNCKGVRVEFHHSAFQTA